MNSKILKAGFPLIVLSLFVATDGKADDLHQMLPSAPLHKEATLRHICAVTLRVVEGQNRVDESSLQEIRAGEALSDVGSQLQALPFKQFRLIGSKERSVSLGEEAVFNVVAANEESHSIHIVPAEVRHGKVGLSLNWFGPTGENMLDTKVAIKNGQNMVFGADGSGEASSILCLKVSCN